jgi:hypothetical protein
VCSANLMVSVPPRKIAPRSVRQAAGNDDQNDSLFLQLTLISALRVIRLS